MHAPYALILDDHPLVAQGLAHFLRSIYPEWDVLITSHPSQADQLLLQQTQQRSHPPVLMVVDVWLSEGACTQWLKARVAQYPHPKTVWLAISGDDNPRLPERISLTGVQAFLHKQAPPTSWKQALHALMQGDRWYSEAPTYAAATIRPPHEWPVTPAELGLTLRQGEVLHWLLQGLSNKLIARQINVSENTVKEHVSAVLERLGASSRLQVTQQLRGRHLHLGQE